MSYLFLQYKACVKENPSTNELVRSHTATTVAATDFEFNMSLVCMDSIHNICHIAQSRVNTRALCGIVSDFNLETPKRKCLSY